MKIRVAYTTEVEDWYRVAVRAYYGQEGLATRDEMKAWFEEFGGTMDDEMSQLATEMGLFDE